MRFSTDDFKKQPVSAGAFSRWWLLVAALSVIVGFGIRSGYVLHGYESFSSDEALNYKALLAKDHSGARADLILDFDTFKGPRYFFAILCSWLAGGQLQFFPFLFCAINILFYLLWILVLLRRFPGHWHAALPLLLFIAVPGPLVSYLGTGVSEIRCFYFYGPLLVFFAGGWMKKTRGCLALGFLAGKGCLDDPFTLFFLVPVLIYEMTQNPPALSKMDWRKGSVFAGGLAGGTWWGLLGNPWIARAHTGYVHAGLSSVSDWWFHAKLILEAWPLYWTSNLPWGYLQQSQLGLALHPAAPSWTHFWVPAVFWVLFGGTALGAFLSLPKPRWREALLWGGPFLAFVVFFIFGNQAWDAMTLRYLGLGQMIPAIWLSRWAAVGPGKRWIFPLAAWACFNGFFLIRSLSGPVPEPPGFLIAERLETAGIGAGFSNYWVAGVVDYYSKGRVLLTPYNYPPLSRRAFFDAQNEREIGLIWVEGLDEPRNLPVVEDQLRSLNFQLERRIDFGQERWCVYVWRKTGLKP